MNKKDRQIIFDKYNGRCAYSGTILESDWQVDHIKPVVRNWWSNSMIYKDQDVIHNMVPTQKLINHYKHSYDLNTFRTWLLGGLHERLKKVPKNPRTEKGKARKRYILTVAGYFGITEDKPFLGVFYFESFD